MKIEAGKFYKMRCGGVVGPMKWTQEVSSKGWALLQCENEQWLENGSFYFSIESIFDLIEEVPDPSLTSRDQEAKPSFDRAAFRRETAVAIMCRMAHADDTIWLEDHAPRLVVKITDALLEELGE